MQEELIKAFIIFMKANRDEEEMAFALTFLEDSDTNFSPGATVCVYQNGIFQQTIYNAECYSSSGTTEFLLKAHQHYLIYCKSKNAIKMVIRQLVIPEDNFKPDTPHWDLVLSVCRYYQHANLLDILKLLVERHGIKLKAKTNDNWNALHIVCRFYGHENLIEIIRFLFDQGIDVKVKTRDSWNALHIVCRFYTGNNLTAIIQFFIDRGIEAKKTTRKEGTNALHSVCCNYKGENLIEVIRFLVNKGIDARAKDNEDCNALHFVCRNYNHTNLIEIVRFFIGEGIDVKDKTRKSNDALKLLRENYNGENLDEISNLLTQPTSITYDDGRIFRSSEKDFLIERQSANNADHLFV